MKVSEINRQAIWPAVIVGGATLAAGALSYLGAGNAADAQKGAAQTATGQQQDQYRLSRADLAPWREAGTNALQKLMGGYDVSNSLLGERPRESKYMKQHHIKGGKGTYTTFDQKGYAKAMEKWESKVRRKATPVEGLLDDLPPGYEPVPEFEESPGYQWTLDQGLKAGRNALSAMGRSRSGSHIKSATEYAENLASTEYDNFLNRWYKDQTEKRNAFNAQINPFLALSGMGQTATENTAQLGANTANQLTDLSVYRGNTSAQGDINQANALTGAIQGGVNNYLYANSLRNLPQSNYQPYQTGTPNYTGRTVDQWQYGRA